MSTLILTGPTWYDENGTATTGDGPLLAGMGLQVQRPELIDAEHDVGVAATHPHAERVAGDPHPLVPRPVTRENHCGRMAARAVANTTRLVPVGQKFGYEHLWQEAAGTSDSTLSFAVAAGVASFSETAGGDGGVTFLADLGGFFFDMAGSSFNATSYPGHQIFCTRLATAFIRRSLRSL